MKNIILCADDYGQNPAISQAIIALFENNRLTATSCMTNSDYWQLHAKWLAPFKDKFDIGLHFNLTTGKALSPDFQKVYGETLSSLSNLLLKASLKRLNKKALESELHAQLDRFIEGVGYLPKFMDGHQHIQHFPVIRDIFLNVYESRLRKNNSYVRSVFEPNVSIFDFKKRIIQLSGAKKFKEQLDQLQIPHNTSFSGVYSFKNSKNFPGIFLQFLNEITEGGLIMCHPGLPLHSSDPDSHYTARHDEFDYLSGEKFLADCAEKQIKIAK